MSNIRSILVSPKRVFVFWPDETDPWIVEPISVSWDKSMEMMFEDYGLNVHQELGKKKGALYLYIDKTDAKPMDKFVHDVKLYLLEYQHNTSKSHKEKIDSTNVLIYNWPQNNVDSMRESSAFNMDAYFKFINQYLAHR